MGGLVPLLWSDTQVGWRGRSWKPLGGSDVVRGFESHSLLKYRSFGNGQCHNYDYHNGINNLFKIILYSYSNVFNILWKTIILINNMLRGFRTIIFNIVTKGARNQSTWLSSFKTITFNKVSKDTAVINTLNKSFRKIIINMVLNVWNFYRILIPKQNQHDSKFRSY